MPAKIPVLERFFESAQYDFVSLTPDDKAADDEEKVPHEKDRLILRSAIKANVDILISGDGHLVDRGITNPKIMRAVDFLNMG